MILFSIVKNKNISTSYPKMNFMLLRQLQDRNIIFVKMSFKYTITRDYMVVELLYTYEFY